MNKVKIAWYGKHFGEEPPLVGGRNQGAGTIFFSGCNLRCAYCQNYQISQGGIGQEYSVDELADIMLRLQRDGAVNIDLVTPTIWWQQIKQAIILAKEKGLMIPIVWNSNAYEAVDILRQMNGLVDVYLPDFKYGIDELGQKYSDVPYYSRIATAAIREMFRQVGNVVVNEDGVAMRGLIVRHLILPNNIENSFQVLKILSQIDKNITISLMSQYAPIYKSAEFKELNRKITRKEFDAVFDQMRELGLENGWVQDGESAEILVPGFRKENPFNCDLSIA